MAEVERELLNEAYLEPIRFALLVDDEFPAYGQAVDKGDRAMQLVELCRSRGWLCDVENKVEDSGRHLQQSDLLIIDFHLDPAQQEDCTSSVRLLQELAVSPHFNIALVYTSDTPKTVALNVAFALGGGGEMPDEESEQALSDLKDDSAGEFDFNPDIEVIKGMVGDPGHKKAFVSAQGQYCRKFKGLGKAMLARVAREYFARRMRHEAILARPPGLSLECNVDAEVPWISTPNLFVAVVNKKEPPDVLLEKLADGLAAANPTPLQVMMVQARAALEKAGSAYDRSILRSPITQAGWLLNVLSNAPAERAKNLGELYGHLFTSLASEMQAAAGGFGAKVIGDAEQGNALAQARALSRVADGEPDGRVYHAANEFLCSEPPAENGLLAPGIIFTAQDGKGGRQFWMCTTPSCDLVPGQNDAGWDGQLGSFKAVYATRLSAIQGPEIENRLGQANNGRHIFITVDDVAYAFEAADEVKRQAKLEVMFVGDEGRYAGRRFEGLLVREQEGIPTLKASAFRVVAKLRPGYSAKFLMDAGMQKARIGLKWLPMPKTVPPAEPQDEAAAA